jgi:hypothetical protein
MRWKHNAQLANFDVTSFACYLGPLSTATSNPTAGDHQRVNAENKNDADEGDA